MRTGDRRARRRRASPRRPRRPRREAGSGWRTCRRRSPGRRRRAAPTTPKALNEAQRIPICAAQKPIAPSSASPPRDGSRTNRGPRGCRPRASPGRSPGGARCGPVSCSCEAPEKRRSRSPGTSEISRKTRITPPAIAAGTIVIPGGRRAAEDAGAQQDPVDQQGDHVDRVEEDEEGDHPRGGLLARHPGLAQRPVGEDDAAGAAGREQPGRREAGHRDVVASPSSAASPARRRRRGTGPRRRRT